jgi:hypothetical protein
MIKVYPVDIYDKDGNLLRIEFLNKNTNEFEFQAEWDDRDAQTHEKREEFRKWSAFMAKRLGFEICL